MPSRPYRMNKRAQALEATRNQIIWAAMQLHAEKGPAATSQADVAARAGISPATVYRHFPTQGSLIRACGNLVWMALEPPRPEDGEELFGGLDTTRDRLRRFVEEVSEFYQRAWSALQGARDERSRVPELEAGLIGLFEGQRLAGQLLQALALEEPDESRLQLTLALTDFGV